MAMANIEKQLKSIKILVDHFNFSLLFTTCSLLFYSKNASQICVCKQRWSSLPNEMKLSTSTIFFSFGICV